MTNDPYAGKAGVYSRVVDPLNRSLHTIALRTLPPAPGMRVLDMGCGTGVQLAGYLALGCSVSGVDRSPSMMARARARLGEDADLRLADATSVPFSDGTFDIVLASLFLHELPADVAKAVLGEMERVMKPSGVAVIIEYGTGPLSLRGHVARAVSWGFELAAGMNHFRHFQQFLGAGGLAAALEPTGLRLLGERSLAGGNMTVSQAVTDDLP